MKKLFIFFLFILANSAVAGERIFSFDSNIEIQNDASIIVTETITLSVEGEKIKRGIYRDLPRTGGQKYDVLSVERNGKPEPYFTQYRGSDLRINTGNDSVIDRKKTQYRIKYLAQNVIQDFDDFDELYWNVTGNGWDFPIDRVSARIVLPKGATEVRQASYIGEKGSKKSAVYKDGIFYSSAPLARNKGMTIAIGFTKGFIEFKESSIPAPILILFTLFWGYLFATWFFVGRDPAKEAIMPRYDVIKELSPAQAGYVYTYGSDSACLICMAFLQGIITKFLKIDATNGFTFSILRKPESGEEKYIANNITFPLTINTSYNRNFEKFSLGFMKFLKAKTGSDYFVSNKAYTFGALLLFLAFIGGACYLIHQLFLAVVFAFYIPFFWISVFLLQKMLRNRKFSLIAIILTGFVCFHFYAMIHSFLSQAENPPYWLIVGYLCGIAALPVYGYLIKRPTDLGARVIEQIEGIRMFLSAVKLYSGITFEKMEKLQPHAVLLGMEDQFNDKMKQLIKEFDFSPEWYNPTLKFGHLKSNISSVSTKPSSRSASGGGGFSGGGFGGGGGGGR